MYNICTKLVCTQSGRETPLILARAEGDSDTNRNGVWAVSFVIVYLSFTDSNRILAAGSHRRVNRFARRRAPFAVCVRACVCTRLNVYGRVYCTHQIVCILQL